MNMALLWLSVGVATMGGALNNRFSKKWLKSLGDCFLFNAISATLATVLLFALASNRGMPSGYTLWMGVCFGFLTAISRFFSVYALRLGPLSFTTMFGAYAMIIPTMFGAIVWQEPVTAFQIVGVLLLLASFYFSANPKKEKSVTIPWLLCCLAVFMSSGAVGVMQKIHQTSPHQNELDAFLIVAFAVSTVVFLLLSCVSGRLWKEHVSFPKTAIPGILGMAAISGVSVAVCNKINLYLSGQMASVLFYPMVNGGGIVAAVLIGVIFFRERLSKLQITGVVLGTAGILLISKLLG